MPAKKLPKLSLEVCQKLLALIITAKHLSSEEQNALLNHVRAIWPVKQSSFLRTWAYPEIHRLVNGMGTLQGLPPSKRFKVKSASRMVAKVMNKPTEESVEAYGRDAWCIFAWKRPRPKIRNCAIEKIVLAAPVSVAASKIL
jgi:hypothetical protein